MQKIREIYNKRRINEVLKYIESMYRPCPITLEEDHELAPMSGRKKEADPDSNYEAPMSGRREGKEWNFFVETVNEGEKNIIIKREAGEIQKIQLIKDMFPFGKDIADYIKGKLGRLTKNIGISYERSGNEVSKGEPTTITLDALTPEGEKQLNTLAVGIQANEVLSPYISPA